MLWGEAARGYTPRNPPASRGLEDGERFQDHVWHLILAEKMRIS